MELNGDFSVTLKQGSQEEVMVTADANLQNYIYTEMIGNKLVIGMPDNTTLRGSKEIQIVVTVKKINMIHLAGSNKLTTTSAIDTDTLQLFCIGASNINLQSNTHCLNLVVPGAAKVEMSGKTRIFHLRLEGASSIQTLLLDAQTVKVNLAGAARIQLAVKDSLEVYLSGAGIIQYKGNPHHKNLSINGYGKIEPMGNN